MNRASRQPEDSDDGWQTARTVRFSERSVDLARATFDAETVKFCPKELVHRYRMVPFRDKDGVIRIAIAAAEGYTIFDIADKLDRDLQFVKASPEDIERAIQRLYP